MEFFRVCQKIAITNRNFTAIAFPSSWYYCRCSQNCLSLHYCRKQTFFTFSPPNFQPHWLLTLNGCSQFFSTCAVRFHFVLKMFEFPPNLFESFLQYPVTTRSVSSNWGKSVFFLFIYFLTLTLAFCLLNANYVKLSLFLTLLTTHAKNRINIFRCFSPQSLCVFFLAPPHHFQELLNVQPTRGNSVSADLRNSESIYRNWQFCHLITLLEEPMAHQLVILFGG